MNTPNFEELFKDMTTLEAQEYVLAAREAFIMKLYKEGIPMTTIGQRMGGSSYAAVRKTIRRHE